VRRQASWRSHDHAEGPVMGPLDRWSGRGRGAVDQPAPSEARPCDRLQGGCGRRRRSDAPSVTTIWTRRHPWRPSAMPSGQRWPAAEVGLGAGEASTKVALGAVRSWRQVQHVAGHSISRSDSLGAAVIGGRVRPGSAQEAAPGSTWAMTVGDEDDRLRRCGQGGGGGAGCGVVPARERHRPGPGKRRCERLGPSRGERVH
jgi:hypothetical protein